MNNQATYGAWQFSIDKFVNIAFDGNNQIIGDRKPLPIPQLVCVFVIAAEKYGVDQFFVVEWSKVQDIFIANHTRWLNADGGIRPREPDSMSMHCTLDKINLEQ